MNKDLGRNIASFRTKLNLTQSQLAEKLCVTYQTVSNWERGVSFPDVESIGKLCEIFRVSSDELFGFTERKRDNYVLPKKIGQSVMMSYTEKAKSAKILSVLMYLTLATFLANNLIAFKVFGVSLFVAVLYLISAAVYIISYISSFIMFAVGKRYVDNKVYIICFYLSFATYFVLTIVGVSSVYNAVVSKSVDVVEIEKTIKSVGSQQGVFIASLIFYYVSAFLSFFAFKSKARNQKIFNLEIAYFALLTVSAVLNFAIGDSLDFLQILSFYLLYLIKEDKFVEIPYYVPASEIPYLSEEKRKEDLLRVSYSANLTPESLRGVPNGKRNEESAEDDFKPIKIKIKLSDIFSGGFLKFITLAIISVVIMLSISTGLFSITDIVVLLGILPIMFYVCCFVLKKGSGRKIVDYIILTILLISIILQNFIFMENLSLRFLPCWVSVINVAVWLLSIGYYIYFYDGRTKSKLTAKTILFVSDVILSVIFMAIAAINPQIYLGLLFIIFALNMITAFVASLLHQDRLT